ncbi:hypothetical protein H072_8672 [Dactylellina haptotyla CBS 200.50]|uniref:Uncharacterized protein n=1 Tax=Dactylellina haptotyla (strain CBS 200.50) TaxID=1284197 RepID=S8BQV0_DACHA|nr:hypothetical protein H072_8672 [Dactylellina haptotyla CBS 200.50]
MSTTSERTVLADITPGDLIYHTGDEEWNEWVTNPLDSPQRLPNPQLGLLSELDLEDFFDISGIHYIIEVPENLIDRGYSIQPLRSQNINYRLLPKVLYIISQVESHIALEVSTRILSAEFPLTWEEVRARCREEHLKPNNFNAWMASIDYDQRPRNRPEAVGLVAPLHAPMLPGTKTFYRCNEKAFRWSNMVIDVLGEMSIKPNDWTAARIFKGELQALGHGCIPKRYPAVNLKDWVPITHQFLDVMCLRSRFFYKLDAMLEVVKAAQGYFAKQVVGTEIRVTLPCLDSARSWIGALF